MLAHRSTLPTPLPANAPVCVLSGYYGFNNLGDELLLSVLVEQLQARGSTPLVLSANPALTQFQHGVAAVSRTNPLAVVTALRQASLLISGGGGLFQDVTGPVSPAYYGGIIQLAKWLGTPVAMVGQSIGPLTTTLGQRLTAHAVKQCQLVALRDSPSVAWAKHYAQAAPLTMADLAWLTPTPPVANTPHHPPDVWRVGVSLRPHAELTHQRIAHLAHVLCEITAESTQAVEFVMLPFYPAEDEPVLHILASYLQENLAKPRPAMATITWPTLIPEAVNNTDKTHFFDDADAWQRPLHALASCHMVVGMRFHAVLMAMRYGVPVFGLAYDPKVDALLDSVLLRGCSINQLETLDSTKLRYYFSHYPLIPQQPQQDSVQVALNALAALYF
jgi:polysaccharide pyruvyl transferase CsaB